MTLTIKIGSNVLTASGGVLDVTRMEKLVGQIAQLHADGHRIILVTSGAVAAGRSMMRGRFENLDPIAQRQLLSSIGQVKLMNQYKLLFDEHGIRIGQILVTKEDFRTREHYLNMRQCIEVLWESGVIPVVNENDTVSLTGLMFTDNDELSGLLASMMDCEKLFILSNIDGIFNGDPKAEGTSVIREIKCGTNVSQYVQTTKSGFGRGGMQTKCRTAQKTAASGIDVYIANGTKDDVILQLAAGDETLTRTHFESGRRSPAIKKWIAYSDGFAKATVTVNQRACQALLNPEKAASLLTAGIVEFGGEFKKNDILLIKDQQGNAIGVGRASFDKETAMNNSSGHSRPLVHYDYLYIYPQND